MSILHQADMSVEDTPRSYIKRIRARVNHWPLRGWSRRYHPFAACDLGFEEAISQHRHHRDRIEDEDQQDHRVDQVDVELVEGHGDHQFETDPVKQRQGPVEFRIPWAPEPVGSARRRRWREGLFWRRVEFINVLHVQSLSGGENSTGRSDMEPGGHHHGSAIARKKSVPILFPSLIPSPLHPCFRSGPRSQTDWRSERTPR